MRFFSVFTLVCWVFLATLYLPIASADDDDGSGAAPADDDDDGSGGNANTPAPAPYARSEHTGPKKLAHYAASPSEFPPYLPPAQHPSHFSLHDVYLFIFLFRFFRASQQPDARRMLRRGS